MRVLLVVSAFRCWKTVDDVHQTRAELLQLVETGAGVEDLSPAARAETLERLLGRDVCRRIGIYALPSDFTLSVVIPVFNEVDTVQNVIQRVRATRLPCEMIVVDDGSTDGVRELLQDLARERDIQVVFHDRNQGKGAALRTGFLQARGDVVVVQDADMEYDPEDFWMLLQPIIEGSADVVYGSRFSGAACQVAPLWHLAANRLITTLFSMRQGRRFTDVETCYKMFRRDLIQDFAADLRERGFGIEIELTARLLKLPRIRFSERPIQYVRRSYDEGKKIGWRDGLRALWCILRY